MEMVTHEAGIGKRWRSLTINELISSSNCVPPDPTLVYCPLDMCHTPIPRPLDVDEDSPWERLRTCPSCSYSFCVYCKRTWYVSAGS